MRVVVAAVVFVVLCLLGSPCAAAAPRAYVVDGRLSVLRTSPDLAALVVRRLGAGRSVLVLARRHDRDGVLWLRVAVTRRTRGWMLDRAVATPGESDGEDRLVERLAHTKGLVRLRLARLAIDRFPRVHCPGLRAAEAESAIVAEAATKAIRRRLGELDDVDVTELRLLVLSDPALDAYSKLGVAFDVDASTRTLVVRGIASSWRTPRRGARLSLSSEGVEVRRCNQ